MSLPDPLWQPIEIVYGVYRLQGALGGFDRWWIQRLVESESGWMVHGDLFLDAPEARYVTLDVEMSEAWAWCYLNLRDDRGRLLAAEVAKGELIVEQAGREQQLPFGESSELAGLSPFLTSLTLRRLALTPGQSATRPTISFDATTFAPRLTQVRYSRMADSVLELGGARLPVQQISRHELDSGAQATLLVRDDGLLLHQPAVATLAPDERASAGRGRRPPLDARGR